jgi:hypothetical protein
MDETDARIHDFDLDEPDGETAGMYPVARSYAKATGVHSHIHCRLRRPMERRSKAHCFSTARGRTDDEWPSLIFPTHQLTVVLSINLIGLEITL